MHRHGYKGTKLHRQRDQREALIKGLADSLIQYESIETTYTKAKAVAPYVERLITKAKKNDLHNRRLVIQGLQTLDSAHKLVDEIAPKLGQRSSGYLRVKRTSLRRGDLAQLARIDFVDDLKAEVKQVKATNKDVQTTAPKKVALKTTTTTKPAPTRKTQEATK